MVKCGQVIRGWKRLIRMFGGGGFAVGVSRQGQYLVTQITTGPQDLLLMLDLADERIADPFVTCIAPSLLYRQPDDEVVRAAVLAGTDRANAECGSSWHPLEIRYWYCGYDRERCWLFGRAAHEIVSQLHHRGLAEIEVVPEPRPTEP